MSLPDYLPGYPPMYGVKQELEPHYQGDALTIPIFLKVNPLDYKLTAYLKEDLHIDNVVWIGTQDDQGVQVIEGKVYVKIPAVKAQTFASGLYYLAVVGCTPQDVKNTYTVLFQTALSITPSASSPYPIAKGVACSTPPPSIVKDWIYTPIAYYY